MVRSASLISGINAPFLGYNPYNFAAFVEVTSTNFCNLSRFADKARESRVSTPGQPLGTGKSRISGTEQVHYGLPEMLTVLEMAVWIFITDD